MATMGRHILFSGCAATHDRRPVRDDMRDLARDLHLDLRESPITVCCGARARDAGLPNARHLLKPLLARPDQGQDIVCFSPACRCALSAHLAALARDGQAATNGAPAPIPQVRDIVDLLAATDNGPGPLHAMPVPRRLSFLQVALHATCHREHDPAQWSHPETPARGDGSRGLGVTDGRLADLVAASGARILADVSGECGGLPVPHATSQAGGEAQSAAGCLSRAAAIGAEVLITPCIICYTELRRRQRTLPRGDAARTVRVLHLAQLLRLACTPGPIVWTYGAQQA